MARKAAAKTQGRTPRQTRAPDADETKATDAPRRGRKPKQREEQLSELVLADLFLPGGAEPGAVAAADIDSIQLAATPLVEHDDEPKAASKLAGAAADDAVDATRDAAPAKARRGRRPKAQLETGSAAAPMTDADIPMMDAPPENMKTVVGAEKPSDTGVEDTADDVAGAPSAKPHRGRARKAEADPSSPATQPEQRNDGPMAHLPADDRADAEAEAQSGVSAIVGSAVHWDLPTDTATFDWLAIEQVAAAQGPNQGMAKLLLAARAEGANSRWPF